MKWTRHLARKREIHSYILAGKPEEMRPLERSRHKWEDDINIILN